MRFDRLSMQDQIKKDQEDAMAEREELRAKADRIRVLLGTSAWKLDVKPYIEDFMSRAVSQVMSTPESGQAEIFLKGSVDGLLGLEAYLEASVANADAAFGFGEEKTEEEDNLDSGRFG